MFTIKSIPLKEITQIQPEINTDFIEAMARSFPHHIKINPTNYIVNNVLTITSPHYIPVIAAFNVLLQTSRAHCSLLQLTKN